MIIEFKPTTEIFSCCFVLIRNNKHVLCFYQVMETGMKVWENEKC